MIMGIIGACGCMILVTGGYFAGWLSARLMYKKNCSCISEEEIVTLVKKEMVNLIKGEEKSNV